VQETATTRLTVTYTI